MSQGSTSLVEVSGAANVAVGTTDPDFIIYLLDPEQEYNCYFVVGNPALGSTERIGVVKKMLLAHSVVFRAELQDSKIAEKNDVNLIDAFPNTFKNLLRFVYGHDNTQGLSFDEADNLLYVADKYMMSKLKHKLVSRLMTMLDYSNICSLMNNPACYTALELNSAITDILQCETDQVLASPQFLDLSSLGFLKILEQEVLNVPEIELWRAAIQWAKNRVETGSGQSLRNELDDHLKHIRVCTMTVDEIFYEVFPTEVLSNGELLLVSKSHKTREVQPDLTTICNVIEERERPLVESEVLTQSLTENDYGFENINESTFNLKTKDTEIQLCSVQLFYCAPAHQCNCTISIQRDTEPPTVVRFEGQLTAGYNQDIPILENEKNVQLAPNSTYSIKCTFSCSVETESGQCLRNELDEHLKHIRVCTMTGDDISHEVLPTEVLTCGELKLVSKSHKTREVQPDLTTICNVIEERDRPLVVVSEVLTQSLRGDDYGYKNINESTFNLKTKDTEIQLCSLWLYNCAPAHQCNCTISIQRDTEPPTIVRFEGLTKGFGKDIPILENKKNVKLAPNSTYSVKCTFSCSGNHWGLYRQSSSHYTVYGNHFSVDFQPHSVGHRIFHFNNIKYKTVTKRLKSVKC